MPKLSIVTLFNTPIKIIYNQFKKLSLRQVIVVPFVLEIIAAVSLTGYLSFQNGQQAVNNVATQLRQEVGERIRQNLNTFLITPRQINQNNQNLVTQGLLNINNLEVWEKYLWNQIQLFDSITFISVTNNQGDQVTAQQLRDGTKLINLTKKPAGSSLYNFYSYNTNSKGEKTTIRKIIPNLNHLEKPWYKNTRKKPKPIWTVAPSLVENTLIISATQRLYDPEENQVLGVLNTSLRLDYMGEFLRKLKIGKTGQAFVIDYSGLLIVTSTQEQPFTIQNNQRELFKAVDSNDRLTALTARFLVDKIRDFNLVYQPQHFDFMANGIKHFVEILPFEGKDNLNCLIVVVIPESDFMEQVNFNNKITILLCLSTLVISTIIGILTSRWVIKPILSLNETAKILTKGNLSARVIINRSDEVGELAISFNQMAEQLQESFANLEKINQVLESRVTERTASLANAEAEMRGLFAAMNEIIMVFDITGRCLKIVTTNSAILYQPINMQLGKKLDSIFPPDQAKTFLNRIQESLLNQRTINFEYSLIINDQECYFAASISPISPRTAIWVGRDVSEQKLLEQKLQSSANRMSTIFAAMTDIIIILDQDGSIEAMPTNTALLYGDETDIINYMIEQFLDPDNSANWYEAIENCLNTQQSIQLDYSLNIDDKQYWFAAYIAPLSQHSVIWVARDISDRKQVEQALAFSQSQSESLLLNILPKSIADRLKKDTRSIAENFDEATILFADIVGFTTLSASMSPINLVNLLNTIFSQFDELAEKHHLEKIKTIGDAYMVVGGLPIPLLNHVEAVAEMALDMQEIVNYFVGENGEKLQIRIGFNTGPIVAGVIGKKKFIYDLWGDAVNVASRMESSGMPGKIQVTSVIYEYLKDKYLLEERGLVSIKGKGEMTTYWLVGKRSM